MRSCPCPWTPSSKRAKPPPCLTRWAPSPNSAPDVTRSSWEFPEGTGVGDTRNPSDLVSQGLDPKNSSDSLRLRFHVRNGLPRAISATQKDHGWDAIVWKGRLYVLVDVSQMNDSGSKEAFVSLLEYAEEVLECSDVIVCFQKCQSSNTKTAIRNFLFLGFQPLAPGHEYLPTNPNLVCFLYAIWTKSSNCDILLIELKIRIKLIPPYSRMSAIEKKNKKNTKKKKEKMTALFRKWKKKVWDHLPWYLSNFIFDWYLLLHITYPPQFPIICVVKSFFTSVKFIYSRKAAQMRRDLPFFRLHLFGHLRINWL